MVDRDDLKRLKELYGVRTESEAARKALRLAALSASMEKLAELTQATDGLSDISLRYRQPLPHEWPEDEPMEGLEQFEERAPAATKSRRRR